MKGPSEMYVYTYTHTHTRGGGVQDHTLNITYSLYLLSGAILTESFFKFYDLLILYVTYLRYITYLTNLK